MNKKILSVIIVLSVFLVGLVCYLPDNTDYLHTIPGGYAYSSQSVSSYSNVKMNRPDYNRAGDGIESTGSVEGSYGSESFLNGESDGTPIQLNNATSRQSTPLIGGDSNIQSSSMVASRNNGSGSFASGSGNMNIPTPTSSDRKKSKNSTSKSTEGSDSDSNGIVPLGEPGLDDGRGNPSFAPPGGGEQTGGIVVPIGGGFSILLILAALFIIYKSKRMIRRSSLLIICLLTYCVNIQGQAFEARSDNKFVTDATSSATINILKNDELGFCTENSIVVQLLGHDDPNLEEPIEPGEDEELDAIIYTKQGGTISVNEYNRVVYTPPSSDFSGQDEFSYILWCGRTPSSDAAKVLVNVNSQPDNIVWEGCFLRYVPIEWGIMESTEPPGDQVSTFIQPVAGDLNGDGYPEVVTGRYQTTFAYAVSTTNNILSNGIFIYWGDKDPAKNHQTRTSINLGIRDSSSALSGREFRMQHQGIGPMGIINTKIDGENKALIYVVSKDGYLRAYDPEDSYTNTATNTASPVFWRSDSQVVPSVPAVASNDRFYVSVNFADFNGDGIPEVYIGDRIFCSATGKLLVQGESSGNRGWFTSRSWPSYCTTIADIDGDGYPDLLAGNKVYKVNIVSLDDVSQNSLELIREAPGYDLGDGKIATDGMTIPIDINNDGNLDILYRAWLEDYDGSASNPGSNFKQKTIVFYAWDTQTEETLISGTLEVGIGQGGIMGGIAALGDVNGDDKIEIVMTTTRSIRIFNEEGGNFIEKYSLVTTDNSGATGISLFDFDMDGVDELVYRDETHLRIMKLVHNEISDEFELVNITSIGNVFSGTGYEYPLILDTNLDGAADIVTTGAKSSSADNNSGFLRIFSSSKDPWAMTRPVWNQYAYNPIYVTDSLTVPTNQITPATAFVTNEGILHRPYNNFLRQANLLDNQGLMFRYGPDLTFDSSEGYVGSGVDYTVNIDSDLNATLYIVNQGDANFPSPLQISAYMMGESNFERIYTGSFDIAIGVGETKVVEFTLGNIIALGIDNPHTQLQLRLNEKDEVIPYEDENEHITEECIYYNNYYPSGLYSALPVAGCEGEMLTVAMYPQGGGYTYIWYDEPIEGDALSNNNSITIEKDNQAVQKLYVEVYNGDLLVNSDARYEVLFYLPPTYLIWTGAAETQDWHNADNWYEPANVTPVAFRIPRKCTHVLIPDGLDYYADLSKTNYANLSTPQCADIRFEFGGEVARTDMLDYDRAFVQYNFGYYEGEGAGTYVRKQGYMKGDYEPSYLERDRYHALAITLNKVATGDFAVGGFPGIWQMKFVDDAGASGSAFAGFTQPYNSLGTLFNEDYLFSTAIWTAGHNEGLISEDRTDATYNYQENLDALEGIIEFPFFEDAVLNDNHRNKEYDANEEESTLYYFYQERPGCPLAETDKYPPAVVKRGDDAYRFIFDENVTDDNEFIITAPAGREIMIGNPAMSTMDFDAFYEANADKIENYYRTFNSDNYETNNGFTQFEEESGVTKPIGVLQAFFVKTTGVRGEGNTVDLVYPFKTASVTRETGTGHDLRASRNTDSQTLQIQIENGEHKSSVYLVLNEEGQNNIDQLFYVYVDKTPQLYLIDDAGQRNAIQFEAHGSESIPLGLNFKKADNLILNFKGVHNLPIQSLHLVDLVTGEETDLMEENSYVFDYVQESTYDNRFVLRVGARKDVTGIDTITGKGSVTLYQEDKQITISANQNISSVEIYDAQGRLIEGKRAVNNYNYQLVLESQGVYLVRTVLANGERKTSKVVIK